MLIHDRVLFLEGKGLPALRKAPRESFDFVVAGALFVHLDDREAVRLLELAYGALAQGGTFFFTLGRRSEETIYGYCDAAGISRQNVSMRREETALLIEVQKLM